MSYQFGICKRLVPAVRDKIGVYYFGYENSVLYNKMSDYGGWPMFKENLNASILSIPQSGGKNSNV